MFQQNFPKTKGLIKFLSREKSTKIELSGASIKKNHILERDILMDNHPIGTLIYNIDTQRINYEGIIPGASNYRDKNSPKGKMPNPSKDRICLSYDLETKERRDCWNNIPFI
tara:strand:+ start:464 stop:799 length:336 start_codon:yes stop_codon:yes gene_type:complete